MGIFSTNFRNSVDGLLGNTKDVLAGSSCQAIMAGLNRYRSYLSTRKGTLDSFIGALSCDAELISDAFIEKADVSYAIDDDANFTVISDDVLEPVLNGLLESIHNGNTQVAEDGVTLTDAQGYAYNLIDVRQSDITLWGHHVDIATKANPTEPEQIIIYHDDEDKYYLNNFIPTSNFVEGTSGKINSIWAVLKDAIESSTLNDYILRTMNCVLSGKQVATEVTTLVSEALVSKYRSVSAFGKGISAAFNRGGVYGVACYIMSYVKELCEARVSDDTLQFTDNSRYAPKIYIAGIISAIIEVISTLLTVIVTLFSRIAGIVIGLLGSIISSVFKAINYDYSSTNAAINTGDDVTIPIAPYGILQGELSSLHMFNRDLQSLIEQGENFFYAEIPGGYLVVGPGAFNSDGEITTWRYEFHPSLVDGYDTAEYFMKYLYDNGYLKFSTYFEDTGHFVHPYLTGINSENRDTISGVLSDYWKDNVYNHVLNNGSNDRLSDGDDWYARQIISDNISIGMLFLAIVCDLSIVNDNDYRFSIDGPNQPIGETWQYYTLNISNGTEGKGYGPWTPLTHMGDYWFLYKFNESPVQYIYFSIITTGNPTSLSWLGIYNQCIVPATSGHSLANAINAYHYYGELVCFNNDIVPAIYIPQYDKQTFWGAVIATLVVSALATVAIAITVYKVRKAILKKRAFNQAKVAAAYDAFQNSPTDANYKAYRTAVRKNNLWSNLIGGSKFDMESYWNGATNSTPIGAADGKVSNPFAVLPTFNDGVQEDSNINSLNNDVANQGSVVKLERVIKLIAG